MQGALFNDQIIMNQTLQSRILLGVLLASMCAFLVGCGSNPDGEGLTDQQKLDGAHKARAQQMSGEKPANPTSRDSLPGQNKP